MNYKTDHYEYLSPKKINKVTFTENENDKKNNHYPKLGLKLMKRAEENVTNQLFKKGSRI